MQQWEEDEKKKEYLRSYGKAKARELRILDEIQRLRADEMFPPAACDDISHGTDFGDLPDYLVRLEAEIETLKEERLEKIKLYGEIESRIRKMVNDYEKDVLRLRYLVGMPWEQVALEIGYTYRHTIRIHSDALKSF